MLAKISKADAKWLVEEYSPKRAWRVDHSTIPMYLKAYNIMKGSDRVLPCASCEGKAIAQMSRSMYEQFESEIKAKLSARKKKQKTK